MRSYLKWHYTIFLREGGRGKFAHPKNIDGCWTICGIGTLEQRPNRKNDNYYINDWTNGRLREVRAIYDKIRKTHDLNGQHIIFELNSRAIFTPVNTIKPGPVRIKSPRYF